MEICFTDVFLMFSLSQEKIPKDGRGGASLLFFWNLEIMPNVTISFIVKSNFWMLWLKHKSDISY